MSARPLRVALVSREFPPFYGGGIGTYARWIVEALAAAGVRIHVITEAHDRIRPRTEVRGPVTVHRVPMGLGRGGWTSAAGRFSIHVARRISELWRSDQIDVVEFAECEAAGAALLALRRLPNRPPVIVQLHTPSEQLFVLRSLSSAVMDAPLSAYVLGERLALSLADTILAPSSFIATWAHDHFSLDTMPTVIPYATGPLPPPPAPARTDRPVVLYVGRIEPRKGVESLILAWRRLVSTGVAPARLRLAGADTAGAPDGGSMRAYLLELLGPSGCEDVTFLGRLNSDALRDEYARASLCVIPSLWENFPNTCIEAMSHARPVLVGDAGGMREMIGETRAGLTFIAGDDTDLFRQLARLLAEGPTALAERGFIARERIEALCDPAAIAARRIAHFRETMDRACRTCGVNEHGMATWRRIEQIAAAADPDLGLPEPGPAIERWVERSGVPG